MIDLPYDFEFDTGYRYVGGLPLSGVDAYHEVEARLGWRASENMVLSLVGTNLLHEDHEELDVNVRTERGVYGKLVYRF